MAKEPAPAPRPAVEWLRVAAGPRSPEGAAGPPVLGLLRADLEGRMRKLAEQDADQLHGYLEAVAGSLGAGPTPAHYPRGHEYPQGRGGLIAAYLARWADWHHYAGLAARAVAAEAVSPDAAPDLAERAAAAIAAEAAVVAERLSAGGASGPAPPPALGCPL